MELHFNGQRNIEAIMADNNFVKQDLPNLSENTNKLFLGDNLSAMKIMLEVYGLKNKVDLIYIDPPFATNNVFRINNERANTVSMSSGDAVAYQDTIVGDDFLAFLWDRLLLAKELLSDKGSIYLHIDYKIGHYVKLLMDKIFGLKNFRNDITRIKCNPKNFSRSAYGNIKDLILFYSKTDEIIWNDPVVPYTENEKMQLFKKVDENGRRYTTIPLHAPGETANGKTAQSFKGIFPPKGRHWRSSPEELEKLDAEGLIEWSKNNNPRKIIYADEKDGKKIQDIWVFKDPQYPSYPTEKNIDLLKQIIRVSSNPDSIVLDFFCGSGTTLAAAQELNRHWIGVDLSEKAIEIAYKRLSEENNLFSNNIEVIHI